MGDPMKPIPLSNMKARMTGVGDIAHLFSFAKLRYTDFTWGSWCLKSLETPLFISVFVQANYKDTDKAMWPWSIKWSTFSQQIIVRNGH